MKTEQIKHLVDVLINHYARVEAKTLDILRCDMEEQGSVDQDELQVAGRVMWEAVGARNAMKYLKKEIEASQTKERIERDDKRFQKGLERKGVKLP